MNIPLTEQFPALHQFLSCYFNQDWDFNFANPKDVLEYFFKETSKEEIYNIAKDLERFLSLHLDAASLQKALIDFGFFYTPEADGITSVGWLGSVLNTMQKRIKNA